MKSPQQTSKTKNVPAQTQTLIVTEGIQTAILLTDRSGTMKETIRRFPTPERALSWCRATAVKMVYLPTAWALN